MTLVMVKDGRNKKCHLFILYVYYLSALENKPDGEVLLWPIFISTLIFELKGPGFDSQLGMSKKSNWHCLNVKCEFGRMLVGRSTLPSASYKDCDIWWQRWNTLSFGNWLLPQWVFVINQHYLFSFGHHFLIVCQYTAKFLKEASSGLGSLGQDKVVLNIRRDFWVLVMWRCTYSQQCVSVIHCLTQTYIDFHSLYTKLMWAKHNGKISLPKSTTGIPLGQ